MSGLLLWSGLTLIVAVPLVLPTVPYIAIAGSIVMIIGAVLLIAGR